MPFGITATLGLDGRGFKAGLRDAQSMTNKWAGGLKNQIAGAFTAAALMRATKDVIAYGSKIDDLSKKLGISKRAVQEFDYAAKLSGASIEDVARAFKALSTARLDAMGGGKETSSIFEALGITKEALRDNPLEETMKEIFKAFETKDFGAGTEGMISKILGKSGVEMLPIIKNGFEDAVSEAHRLGVVLDDEVVTSLDDAGDQIDKIIAKFRGPFADAVVHIAELVNTMVEAIQGVGEWFGAHMYGQMMANDLMGGGAGRKGGSSTDFQENAKAILEALAEDRRNTENDRAERRKRREHPDVQPPFVPPTDAKAQAVAGFSAPSDSLSRIGGFVGGGGGTANRLSSIDQELKKLNAQVRAGILLKPE